MTRAESPHLHGDISAYPKRTLCLVELFRIGLEPRPIRTQSENGALSDIVGSNGPGYVGLQICGDAVFLDRKFQADVVVGRIDQVLPGPKVTLGGLDRRMT